MTPAHSLLRAVRDFLRTQQGELSGSDAWQNRICVNVLGILERELQYSPILEELKSTCPVTDDCGEGPDVNLARALRDGDIAVDEQLLRYLRRRSLLRVLIDNPRYSALEQARVAWPEDASFLEERHEKASVQPGTKNH